jgi:hypothetical protein
MMEVTDEQVAWYDWEGGGQMHTSSNPHSIVPVLGSMNSGWLFSHVSSIVRADGTSGIKVGILICCPAAFLQLGSPRVFDSARCRDSRDQGGDPDVLLRLPGSRWGP